MRQAHFDETRTLMQKGDWRVAICEVLANGPLTQGELILALENWVKAKRVFLSGCPFLTTIQRYKYKGVIEKVNDRFQLVGEKGSEE